MKSIFFQLVIFIFLVCPFDTNAQKIYTFNTVKIAFMTVKCEGSIVIEDSTLSVKNRFKGNKIWEDNLYDIIFEESTSDSLVYHIRDHKKARLEYQLVVDFSKNLMILKANNRKKNVVYLYTVN
jgi:hypothetical protein